jgi:hypothetical protein
MGEQPTGLLRDFTEKVMFFVTLLRAFYAGSRK